MKTKIFAFILTLLPLATVFSQSSPLLKYIPAGASTVISFNPVKLANKVPGETFRQSALYREMMKKDDGEIKAFMSDPSISGIDFSNDLLLTIITDTSSRQPAGVSLLGSLKNEALFSLLIKKMSKGGNDSFQVYGNNRMLLPENYGPAIAWNDEVFVICSGNKNGMRNEISGLLSDTSDTRDFEEKFKEYSDKLKRQQRELCFEMLTPKSGGSAFTNSYFSQVMAETGDVKIWGNGSGFGSPLKNLPAPLSGLLAKLQSMAETNKTTVINFENGKISGTTRNFIIDDLAAIHKKYPANSINTDLVKRLPADGKLLGLMVTSMNPEMAKEMMQKMGMNEILDSLKQIVPFDFSLLSSTFRNEAILALMNVPVKPAAVMDEEEDARPKRFAGLQVIVAMPIANKTRFEELRKAMSTIIDSLKGTETGERMMKGFNPSVKYNDSLLVFSMSEEVSTAFLNNPGTTAAPAWLQELTQYPMVMNLNMKEVLNMVLNGKNGDEPGVLGLNERMMMGIFDQMIMTGGNYENGSLNSKMEVRFGNPNENAMKQLFDLVNMLIEQSEQKRKSYEETDGMAPEEEMKIEEVTSQEDVPVPPPPPPPKVDKKKYTPPVIVNDEEVEKPAPPKKNTKSTPVKKTKG